MSTYRYLCPWIVPVRYGDGSGLDMYGAKTEADARALAAHLRTPGRLKPNAIALNPVKAEDVWTFLEQLAAKGART